MKTAGTVALREKPCIVSELASNGELLLMTNRSSPISLSVPFGEDLLESGVSLNMVVKIYRTLNLARSYQLSSYDAAYLELAIHKSLPIATLDTDLRKAAVKANVKLYQLS